jgi:hypothetical protein
LSAGMSGSGSPKPGRAASHTFPLRFRTWSTYSRRGGGLVHPGSLGLVALPGVWPGAAADRTKARLHRSVVVYGIGKGVASIQPGRRARQRSTQPLGNDLSRQLERIWHEFAGFRVASRQRCVRSYVVGTIGTVIYPTSGARRRARDALVAKRVSLRLLEWTKPLDAETCAQVGKMTQASRAWPSQRLNTDAGPRTAQISPLPKAFCGFGGLFTAEPSCGDRPRHLDGGSGEHVRGTLRLQANPPLNTERQTALPGQEK